MYLALKIISLAVSAMVLFLFGGPSAAQPQTAYERGLEELDRGNISLALDIWFEAYESPGRIDSRIGFEYIRVVAEHNMRSYYAPATETYYRALTDGDGTESRIAVRTEIERLQPVTGEGYYRQWTEWWKERHPDLGRDMRGFWIQQDPTPAQPANERLIEHWQRIATAKKTYTKNEKTVYDADERALIYIRYGAPDRTKTGILTIQSINIKPWLELQLTPSTREDTGVESRTLADTEIRDREVADRLTRAVYHWHRYPEYEIWFYDNLYEGQQEPVIFVFGTDVNSGEFALQTTIEDFIPERAYHPQDERNGENLEFTRAGITPALILQLLYYEQLAQVDSFFEARLNRLRTRVLEQGAEAFDGMDLTFRAETRQIMNHNTSRAPRQKSTFEEVIPRIPLEVHHYRFLDDEQNPVLLTYVESLPREAFLIDYHRNTERETDEADINYNDAYTIDSQSVYELVHSLQTYDDQWTKTERLQDNPPLFAGLPSSGRYSISMFQQSHTSRAFQSASVELLNYDPDSEPIRETPFPSALRGWNKHQFRQPAPLLSHPDSLEMADLVLGYYDETRTTEPFSFAVANNRIVPFGETLLLHFEVYNLTPMNSGFTRFELTYRIFPVDEIGNVLSGQTEFILTLNFTNEETTVIEDLEIETADLPAGLYELLVQIRDTESGQSRERTIRFEVTE